MAFELQDNKFNWLGEYDITVDELLGGYSKTNKLQQAKQMVKGLYGANITISSKDMESRASAIGVSKRTLDMAKQELHVKSKRIGDSWYWDLDRKEN